MKTAAQEKALKDQEAKAEADAKALEEQMKKDEARMKLDEKAEADRLAAESAEAAKIAKAKADAGLKDYELKFNLRHKGNVIVAGTRVELTDEQAAEYPKGVLLAIELVPTAVDAG